MVGSIIDDSILGIDFGSKKIGLAIKREKSLVVETLGNFKNQGDVIKKIINLVKEKGINRIVIGKPSGLGGSETLISKRIDIFIHNLKSSLPSGISLETVNENGTTKEALYRLGFDNKKNNKKDSYSAVIIVERYIRENVRE